MINQARVGSVEYCLGRCNLRRPALSGGLPLISESRQAERKRLGGKPSAFARKLRPSL